MQLGVANYRVRRLVELRSRQIIEQFEQESDVPMQHHEALGVLEALGAFHGDDLVASVGAWWARILHKDVAYLLLDGLECIAESRPSAEQLGRSAAARSDPLAAYVVARWHDAAGRIQFRCGDMMAARLEFTAAAGFAACDALWFCRSDIQSNLQRAAFDEQEKAREDRGLQAEYKAFQALHDDTLRLAAEHGVELAAIEPTLAPGLRAFIADPDCTIGGSPERLAAVLPVADARSRLQGREFLRGLANVLHNLSVVCTPQPQRSWTGDIERSRRLSWSSALIAYGLGDGYRLAQALRHSASTEPDDRLATRYLEIVRDRLPWKRGRWMAAQALAPRVPPQQGRAMLEGVLRELRQRQTARGADIGFDVDVHRYTVEVLARVAPDLDALAELRLEAARNIRRVVKVSTYRRRLAEVLYPTYLREIERSCQSIGSSQAALERTEETLSLVEEASARELLDLLAAARADESRGAQHAGTPRRAVEAPVVRARGYARGDVDRQAARSSAYEAIGLSQLRFEQQALYRPIVSTAHDVEIAGALRRLTATQPGLVVVRYFLSGFDRQRASELRAMVFRAGRVTLCDARLDIEAMRQLASEPHAEGPSVSRARRIWDVLVAPVWPLLVTPEVPATLVMIPAAGMFNLPMHIALPPGDDAIPLGIRFPFCMSVSATAYVSRRRHLLQVQPVDPDDDLCALVPGDADVYPGELVGLGWASRDRFHIAGARPEELTPEDFTWWGPGNHAGLDHLLAQRSEFFVYAGHGASVKRDDAVDVALQLADGEYLTQYDLAAGVGLRRNKWTLIDACVSGVGGDTASGEVAGFLRAFIAAGAGALAVTKWRVQDAAIGRVAGRLLRAAARAAGQCIDIVRTLHSIQYCAFMDAKHVLDDAKHVLDDAKHVLDDAKHVPDRDVRDVSQTALPPEGSVQDQRITAGLHACPLVVYL
jgi:hypothetical protein